MSNAENAPFLFTERFELWRPTMADLDGMVELVAHPETRRHLGPGVEKRSGQADRLMRGAGSWAFYGYGMFAVRPRGQGHIVACCGIFHSFRGFAGIDDVPEAGWIVRQDHCGQGLAREVMDTVFGWFDAVHGPRAVFCMIEEGNTASDHLARRLGFTRCGEHRLEDDCLLWLYRRG